MEAEARAILEAALAAPEEDPTDLAAFARGLFAPLGGVDLELPPRDPARDPPGFGGAEPAAEPPRRPAARPEPPRPAKPDAGAARKPATAERRRR
jgi:hypothetical protein